MNPLLLGIGLASVALLAMVRSRFLFNVVPR